MSSGPALSRFRSAARRAARGVLLPLLLLPGAAAAGAAGGGGRAASPGFELRDQFKRPHLVAFPRPRPCVLVLADRRGSKQLEAWIRPLHERYGDRVELTGVAALGGVPRLARAVVRRLFRRGAAYPVLLDWEETVWSALACVPNTANVIVLSPDGEVVHRAHGAAGPEALAACIIRVDGLVPGP